MIVQPAKSLTQATYERLRNDVLSCVLRPGDRVNVKVLAERYNASAGALREALSRMVSEGMVIAEPQKGFRISAISLADLNDLTRARMEIEASCLQHAVDNGTLAWEAGLVVAHHCLSRIDPRDADEWAAAHTAFHEALVNACPNTWLLRIRSMLFEQTARYRAMSIAMTARDRDIGSEHQALLDAALARETTKACELLKQHIHTTSLMLVECLQSVEPFMNPT
ncbi:GntR family transcriptional regulator [Pseudomonas sp. S3E17]|uniref:GntR family transcriptional regulator n=1 Tax=Pseudomonas sp. S3E17 TaxID=2817893 RepID=UPI0020A14E99|nr:FCD domain-containing protein [Pseudomonas sp. S3E17]MCP1463272.1 DNA-binding GntR family transcriptional regulator [Pseudomonas sp. S3E17]